jgi:hypothetical protein
MDLSLLSFLILYMSICGWIKDEQQVRMSPPRVNKHACNLQHKATKGLLVLIKLILKEAF